MIDLPENLLIQVKQILKQNVPEAEVASPHRMLISNGLTERLEMSGLWTYNNVRPHTAIGGIPPR